MTVKKLIKILSKYEGSTLVFVDGYEGGLDQLESVKEITVAMNVSENENYSFYGKHSLVISESDGDSYRRDKKKVIRGIYLPRTSG